MQSSAPTSPNQSSQLEDLQAKFSFLEDHVQKLDAIIAAHDRTIVELCEAMNRLRDSVESVRGNAHSDASLEPPPPHY